MKNLTLWKSLVKPSFHDHNTAVFTVESFLVEVISRSQLPQNKKILDLCLRSWLLQNQHGSDCVLFKLSLFGSWVVFTQLYETLFV